jgi:DNA modification methylase
MQPTTVALRREVEEYLSDAALGPLLLCGDTLDLLPQFPDESIDLCMTSPPYWGRRDYGCAGIGLEEDYQSYICSLERVAGQVLRILKPTGSFWLNIGDTYLNKQLLGIPWRVALALTDKQGWILRNDVVWNKVKGGPDQAPDRLRNVHENIFHFVKNAKGYYYDVDAIRHAPRSSKVVNGSVVSATGVRGVRYRRQIELSTLLTEDEKRNALDALQKNLAAIQAGKLSDFRMIIRGQQRATHSDAETISGRARELNERGFYFLRYHPNGSKPSDVWDVLPEDTQGRDKHFAPYPEDLCRIPMKATCPKDGVVLDPFCGTGTTMVVAKKLQRKSIGIDISADYLEIARERCNFLI